MSANGADDALLRRLAGQRRLAGLVILFERLWPALWPPLGVIGLFLLAALLDLPRHLPPWAHAALLLAALVALGWLSLLAVRRVRRPGLDAVDRRIESDSGLRHRPLQVLTDRPALAGSPALWQAHVARSMAALGGLRVGLPHPGLPARDPRALRAGLVVALAAALVIAGPEAPARIGRALLPGFAFAAPAAPPLLQAWITPPAYTGIAPIFLHAAGGAAAAPAGSHLTVSVTGGVARPTLSFAGHVDKFHALDATSFQAERDLTSGGHLVVRRSGSDVAAWNLTVIADRPPVASFTEPPGRAPRGLQTRLPWSVSDDYGVTGLQAELRLRDRPDAPPLTIAIPLPGGTPKDAHGVAVQDLTANPWAGLPVTARLLAHDALNQQGVSATAAFDLPERRFRHPVARALIAVRKMLTLHPEDRTAALHELDRLSEMADAFGGDLGAYLNLRAIASQLVRDAAPAAIDGAQTRLWQLALHLEEGSADRTARALAQARQELRDALERDKRGEQVDPKELDRLMEALRQALEQHLQALAEQARRDQTELPQDRGLQQLDARQLERLAQQMEDAVRAGRMDEARQRLQELERMLQALQNARPEHGQSPQNAQRQQRERQQMGALEDMVQRQGGLLDKSQSRAGRADPRLPSEAQSAPDAEGRTPDQQRQADQRVQQALRRALGELMQQFGDLTGQIPPSLGEADTAMRDAGQALGQGNEPAAGAAEQRAIEALQKGGREMGQQMARQFGSQPGGEDDQDGSGDQADGGDPYGPDGYSNQPGRGTRPMANGRGRESRSEDRRDPLGRLMQEGSAGSDESNDVAVPDQMEQARTRAIQDELRRRGADRDRPQEELEYIDRLLKQF